MTMKLKKGFTLVELVVVIAVIVILSAVLIPTFANVTSKANEAARDEALAGAEKMVLVEYPDLDRMTLVYEYKGIFYERDSDNNWVVKRDHTKDEEKLIITAEKVENGGYNLKTNVDEKLKGSYETAEGNGGYNIDADKTFNTLKVYIK